MQRVAGEGAQARAHFDVLDGLRGVAALMVLLGHATAVMFGPTATIVPRKGLAVIFFFMLSGFVVASAYDTKLKQGMSPADFMLRRVIRLYPLIILGTLIGAAWFWATELTFGSRGVIAIALEFLALPAPHVEFSFGHFPLNPPQWSLFFEMLAYGSFAILPLGNLAVCVVTIIFFALYGIIDFIYFPSETPIYFLIFEAGASFYCGVGLWRLYEKITLVRWQVPSWLLAAIIAGACLWPAAGGAIVDCIAAFILFPAVVMLGAMKGRGVASPIEKMLGDLSFPVYILHWPIIMACQKFAEPRVGSWTAIVVSIASTGVFAWLVLRLFDEPARRWLVSSFIHRSSSKISKAAVAD